MTTDESDLESDRSTSPSKPRAMRHVTRAALRDHRVDSDVADGNKSGSDEPSSGLASRSDRDELAALHATYRTLCEQIRSVVVGQEEVIEQLLVCVFARGHCILEGVPGLAKTLLVSTLAQAFDLRFHRIQFTPDLMPSDITGTEVLREDHATGDRSLEFVPGPIFANLVLADEINRTPPKTQAALLEAMQEHHVSSAGVTRPLPEPFFVLATQNPIEQEGTYPLPEAQLDRFLMKVRVDYPSRKEERQIYRMTTGDIEARVEPVVSGEQIPIWQHLVRRLPISDHCLDFVLSLVRATRGEQGDDIGEQGNAGAPGDTADFVAWGAGPRAGQALILAAKARAALHGRPCVELDDLRALALPALRHRLVTTYAAQAAGASPDQIIARLLAER